MIINEISHDKEKATITLNYGEIRDITNGLYNASQNDGKFADIFHKFKPIFRLIKHGDFEINTNTKEIADDDYIDIENKI